MCFVLILLTSFQDLEPSDVMILDNFEEIFVWIGEGANEYEKKASLQFAMVIITVFFFTKLHVFLMQNLNRWVMLLPAEIFELTIKVFQHKKVIKFFHTKKRVKQLTNTDKK